MMMSELLKETQKFYTASIARLLEKEAAALRESDFEHADYLREVREDVVSEIQEFVVNPESFRKYIIQTKKVMDCIAFELCKDLDVNADAKRYGMLKFLVEESRYDFRLLDAKARKHMDFDIDTLLCYETIQESAHLIDSMIGMIDEEAIENGQH